MAWISINLGNGRRGYLDAEFPDLPPRVSIENANVFSRIIIGQIYDTEEIRFDKPAIYDGTYEYIGIALSGSSVADPVWSIVRVSWVDNRKTRQQIQTNIAWNNRTTGW